MKKRNLLFLILATSLMISVSFFPIFSAKSISIGKISKNNTTIYSILNPWDDTKVLSPNTDLPCDDQSIAIGHDDTIHVVWAEEDSLFYKTKDKFGTWSYSKMFKTLAGGYCDGTSIDVDLSGTLHLVYAAGSSDGVENIYYMKKPKYGSWSKEEVVSEGSEAESHKAVISAGPDGSVHVAWIEDVLEHTSIRYREKTPSGIWGDIEIIQERAQTVERPAIDVDSSGNVHLAWTMKDPDSGWYGNVYYIKKLANGDWSEKEKVSGVSDAGSPYSINIEADRRGNVHMVWETAPVSANYDEHHIVYCKRSSTGWGSIKYVTSNSDNDDTAQPSFSVDRNGNIHVVCKDRYGSSKNDIIYIKKQNGKWSAPELVSYYKDLPDDVDESYVSCPYVVSDSEGGIHIIWKDDTQYLGGEETGETRYDIFYRHREPGNIQSTAPSTPSVKGPTSGTMSVPYDYEFQAADPDGDQIYYTISWGDGGADEWLGPYESGEKITVTYSFIFDGNYVVRCKVRDENGLESNWGILHVSIPRNKHSSSRYIDFISEKFPLVEQLLKIPIFKQLISL